MGAPEGSPTHPSRVDGGAHVEETWTGDVFMIEYLLFPNQHGRLNIFEPRYLRLFNNAILSDRKFIIHPTGESDSIGIIVRIESYTYMPNHSYASLPNSVFVSIVCENKCRFLGDAVPNSPENEAVCTRVDVVH